MGYTPSLRRRPPSETEIFFGGGGSRARVRVRDFGDLRRVPSFVYASTLVRPRPLPSYFVYPSPLVRRLLVAVSTSLIRSR